MGTYLKKAIKYKRLDNRYNLHEYRRDRAATVQPRLQQKVQFLSLIKITTRMATGDTISGCKDGAAAIRVATASGSSTSSKE